MKFAKANIGIFDTVTKKLTTGIKADIDARVFENQDVFKGAVEEIKDDLINVFNIELDEELECIVVFRKKGRGFKYCLQIPRQLENDKSIEADIVKLIEVFLSEGLK